MMPGAGEREHVVLFPFMAQGHLIPFTALARLIELRKGYRVTIVNTPLNVEKLKTLLPPESTIRLESLPFDPIQHGLPPGSENTDTMHHQFLLNLFRASGTLDSAFERLLVDIRRREGRPPLCVISDMFLGWTVDVARKLGLPHAVFIASGAYGTAILFSVWLKITEFDLNSEEVTLPDFPEAESVNCSHIFRYLKFDAVRSEDWTQFHQVQFGACLRSDGLLFNTTQEMEETGLHYFRRKSKQYSVWAIGPITLAGDTKGGTRTEDNNHEIVEWLDLHPPGSVLFVCFGSMNSISSSQMMQLATGLEASEQPFLWALRPPVEHLECKEFKDEWLPRGYEARMEETKQGFLFRGWAPQMEILEHQSTGMFLSHCGWNSSLESLSKGVPIIAWPLSGEQLYNSHLMEAELGVAVEIARGHLSEVDSGHIAGVIATAMGKTEKGEEMRKKAERLRKVMEDAVRDEEGRKGSSARAFDDFIETALLLRSKDASLGF
ncbi:hypothetical protein H6P81_013805 [Aristolochia fimbriata]|uniref:Glycosyltransferase n=1 Tax=Aristolochia fimbriata TaxID=158543 RepID=A0AAV7EJ03_ARIFI|nr:hypothetical protein H6P81_013805 [Aristolochia fimbriata]